MFLRYGLIIKRLIYEFFHAAVLTPDAREFDAAVNYRSTGRITCVTLCYH